MTSFYISMGLVANDTGESESGTNCFYIAMGLVPNDAAGAGGAPLFIIEQLGLKPFGGLY